MQPRKPRRTDTLSSDTPPTTMLFIFSPGSWFPICTVSYKGQGKASATILEASSCCLKRRYWKAKMLSLWQTPRGRRTCGPFNRGQATAVCVTQGTGPGSEDTCLVPAQEAGQLGAPFTSHCAKKVRKARKVVAACGKSRPLLGGVRKYLPVPQAQEGVLVGHDSCSSSAPGVRRARAPGLRRHRSDVCGRPVQNAS